MSIVEYTHKAREDLSRLDPQLARRILKKVAFYSSQEHPLDFAKPLQGKWTDTFRFRIGDFRAIFYLDRNGVLSVLYILRIKHRKDVYDL